MRITSNTLASRLVDQLDRLSSEQSQLTQQLATGKRLVNANDDVSATGRVMSYESEKRLLQQYQRNAKTALTNIKISFSTLNAVKGIASEVFNIAPAAAASGDPAQRTSLASKVDGLLEQAFSLANSQSNGVYLYGAAANDSAPFTATRDTNGRITGITYTTAAGANGNPPQFTLDEGTQVGATTNGTENQQLAVFLNHLVTVRDAIEADNKPLVNSTQNAIGDDEDNMVAMLSNLSTAEYRINVTQTQNRTRFDQLANLASGETDADMAETIVKFQSSQKSYQAALQAGSKILGQSLLDYI